MDLESPAVAGTPACAQASLTVLLFEVSRQQNVELLHPPRQRQRSLPIFMVHQSAPINDGDAPALA